MKNSLTLPQLGTKIGGLFKRYHIVLFALTVVLGVSVGVFFLNKLNSIADDAQSSQATTAIFDEATIQRVNDLMTAENSNSEFSLPEGRVNPFTD